ncbi:MAG: citrate lyase acyl carrier protein [Tolumonas sp.]
MKIVQQSHAGTLESGDVLIRIQPIDSPEIEIELESVVSKQFGDAIHRLVHDILNKLNIYGVRVIVEDKGALDCIIRARVQAALIRATGTQLMSVNWSAL